MLGVIAKPADEAVAREFFELFKTPWEFYVGGRHYGVVLCVGEAALDEVSAKVLVVYSSEKTTFDDKKKIEIRSRAKGGRIPFCGSTIPVYGDILEFRGEGGSLVYMPPLLEPGFVRVGYDLFSEIRTLLVIGQPSANALTPTIELHIALLRYLILSSGVGLLEIPPTPAGSSFIACLTHDLDHASFRRHKFDGTMWGFLYRATVISALNAARGRLSAKKLLTNWLAAAKSPFVHLGLAEDSWNQFDRYRDLEAGRPSTFYVIPFAGRPGRSRNGEAPGTRGTAYDVSHIVGKIEHLKAAGCEIGLHGIDAWRDSASGCEEASRISQFSGERPVGVRMHWIYGDDKSAEALESARFFYDSTSGYNDAVGYRAGTVQIFRPLGASHLLELPLHVMDTALFYPDYLDCSEEEAWSWIGPIFGNATRYGGALTINWHDRSIAPERLWGDFYARLVEEMTTRGALFCTATQAVSWFQKRRSAVFELTGGQGNTKVAVSNNETGLALRVRVHRPTDVLPPRLGVGSASENYSETALDDRMEFCLTS